MKTYKEIKAKWPVSMQKYATQDYIGELEEYIEYLESTSRQDKQHLSEAVDLLSFIAYTDDEEGEAPLPYTEIFEFLGRVDPDPDKPSVTDCERNWKALCQYLESECPGWSIPPDSALELVIDTFKTILKKEGGSK